MVSRNWADFAPWIQGLGSDRAGTVKRFVTRRALGQPGRSGARFALLVQDSSCRGVILEMSERNQTAPKALFRALSWGIALVCLAACHGGNNGVNVGTGELVYGGGDYVQMADDTRRMTVRVLRTIAGGLDSDSLCVGVVDDDRAATLRKLILENAAEAADFLETISILPVVSQLSMPDGAGGQHPVHALYIPGDGSADPKTGKRVLLATTAIDNGDADIYETHEGWHGLKKIQFQDLASAKSYGWPIMENMLDTIGSCVRKFRQAHAPADVNPSFAKAGLLAIPSSGTPITMAPLAQQGSNVILVTSYQDTSFTPARGWCEVRRFSATGKLDTSFGPKLGVNGVVTIQSAKNNIPGGYYCRSVTVDSDGSIFITGTRTIPHPYATVTHDEWLAHRLTPDGDLDGTFFSNATSFQGYFYDHDAIHPELHGMSVIPIGSGKTAYVLAQDQVVGGTTYVYVAQLTKDGKPDSTFGAGPSAGPRAGILRLPDVTKLNSVNALRQLLDGKLLILGNSLDTTKGWKPALYRVTQDGTLDTYSFLKSVGTLQTFATALLPLPGGLTALTGRFSADSNLTNSATLVGRLGTDCQPDGTFGGGFVSFSRKDRSGEISSGIGLLPTGQLLVAGQFKDDAGTHGIVRAVTSTGDLDTTFVKSTGVDAGDIPYTFGAGTTNLVTVLVQPTGRILVGGFTQIKGENGATTMQAFVSQLLGYTWAE